MERGTAALPSRASLVFPTVETAPTAAPNSISARDLQQSILRPSSSERAHGGQRSSRGSSYRPSPGSRASANSTSHVASCGLHATTQQQPSRVTSEVVDEEAACRAASCSQLPDPPNGLQLSLIPALPRNPRPLTSPHRAQPRRNSTACSPRMQHGPAAAGQAETTSAAMHYAHGVGMQAGEQRLPNCPAPSPLTAHERTSRALLPAWGHGHSRLSSRSSQQAPLLVPMDDAPTCSSPQHSLAAAVSGGSVGRMTPRTRNSRNSKATAATAAAAAMAAALLDHPPAHSRRSSQHVSTLGYTPPSEPLHAWLPSSSASHAVTARTSSDPRQSLPALTAAGGPLQPQLSQGEPAALPKRFSFQGGLDSCPSQTMAGAGSGSGGLHTRTSVGAIGLQHRGDPVPDLALTPRQDAAFDVPRLVGLPQERQQLLRMLGIAVREPSAALAQLAPRTNAMPGGSPTLPESGGLAAPGANAGGLTGAEGMLLARRTPAVSDMLAVTGVGAQLELQAHVRRMQDGTAAAAEARAASGSRAGSGSSVAGDRGSGMRRSCNSNAMAIAAAAAQAMPSAIIVAEGHARHVGSTLVCSRSEALADLSQLEGSTCYVSPFKPPGTLPPLPRAGSGAAARAGGGGGVARRGSLVWDRGVDPDLDLDLQLHQIQEQDDSGDGSGGGGRNTADECRGPALRSTLSGHDRPSATPYTASGKATAAAQGQAHVGFGLPPLSNKVAAGLLSGTGAAAAAGAGSPQWLDASGGRVHADTGVTCSGGLGASLLPTANSADCRSGGSGGSSSSLGPAAAATAACSSMPSRATSLQAAGGANGSSGSGAPTSSSTLRSGPSGKAWPAALLALLGSNTSGGGKAAGDGRGFSGKAAASASVAVAKGSQPLEPQAQRHGKPLQPQPPGSFFRFDRGSSLSEPIADFPPLSAPRSTWLPQLPLFACLCGASAAGEGRHTGGGSGCNDGIGIDTVPCKQADVLVDSHAAAHDLRPGSVLGAHDVAAGKVSLLRPS